MNSIENRNPAWTIENFLEIDNNGRLTIDGVAAETLGESYETPLFVFSEKRIRHNINRLKAAQNAIQMPLKICYAAKANSNMAILRTVKNCGADIEVNSGGELFKALKIGFQPAQIIFNGTSKTVAEHEAAIDAGIYAIQCDSLYELGQIQNVARQINKRANVSLRLVPEIETETMSGLQTAMLTSKFGMLSGEVVTAFQEYGASEFVNLCGIHLHLGSQTPDAAPFAEAFLTLFEHLKITKDETGCRVEHLNLGGGFPTNYLRDDSNSAELSRDRKKLFVADLEPSAVLSAALEAVNNAAIKADALDLLENLTILLEPGRSVVADAGIILTTVRNRKQRPIHNPKSEIHNDDWLLTDAGYNIMLSQNNYKWYYHLISADRAAENHQTPYKIAGPLCDGGDVYFDIDGENRLPDYRLLPENIEPGEVLALLNVGAYSLAQMFPYNGRPLPAAVLIREHGEVELIRKRDSHETLVAGDIW